MQSILTKFIPPTNVRGARIRAVQSGWAGDSRSASVTIPYPHELDSDAAHALAARLLAEKLGWRRRFICAALGRLSLSSYDYCFAIDDGTAFTLIE